MRPRLMVAITIITSLSLLPAPSPAATLTRRLHFDSSDILMKSSREGIRPQIPGGVSVSPDGEPDIPRLSAMFYVPQGYVAESAEVTWISTVDLHRGAQVAPAFEHRFDRLSTGEKKIELWTSSVPYPGNQAEVRNGRMRGLNIATVVFAPLQYIGSENTLRLATDLEITVSLVPDTRDQGLLFQPQRATRTSRRLWGEAFQRLMPPEDFEARISANERLLGPVLKPKINSGEPHAPTFRPSIDGSAVDMVIITASGDDSTEYQRLADFKTRTGLLTVVRTTSWIYENYPHEVDRPATIRSFIKDAAEKWGTTYVLLGGDVNVVPVRTAYLYEGGEAIPTDYYYSDLDGTWNTDGDHVFGEIAYGQSGGDVLDLYADVYVGRIPSTNAAEAEVMVDKILKYQENPADGFVTRTLFLGEVLFPQVNDTPPTPENVELDGADICREIIDSAYLPLGFTTNLLQLYENTEIWNGYGFMDENKANVIDEINDGFGLLHFVGHGFTNTMSVGLGGDQLKLSDIAGLTNAAEQGVAFAMTCNAADITTNSIAEAWLACESGGAAAVISNSSVNFVQPELDYQDAWYNLVFTQHILELGAATAVARDSFIAYSGFLGYSTLLLNTLLLGDPSMPMWVANVRTFNLSHSGSFDLGAGTYSVVVTDSTFGYPVTGARVCLSKAGDAYAVAYTDSTGTAVVPWRPDLTGTFTVSAFADSFLAKTQSATVSAPSAPYVFALSQAVDDAESSPIVGNDDGKANAGETIGLTVSLKNNGTVTASGVSGILRTSNPYLTITDSTYTYGSISAGSSASQGDPYLVEIDKNTPDRTEARCTLEASGSNGTFTQEIILYIHAPRLEYTLQVVRDSLDSAGDGIIDQDERFAIRSYVTNRGLGEGRGVEVRLRATDPYVTITDSVIALGNITSGNTATSTSDILIAEFSDTLLHTMTAVLIDYYGAELTSIEIDVDPPDQVSGIIPQGTADAIKLRWTPTTSPGLLSYNVYRAASLPGTFSRVNATHNEKHAYYSDENLSAFTQYYYCVSAVDSSGNEGARSDTISATTTLPLHSGFPVEVGASTVSGITLADINDDGKLDIITGGDEIYAVQHDGSEVLDGDQDTRTYGPFSATGGKEFWGTPAVGDVDEDGDPDIAAVTWRTSELYLWRNDGSVFSGFPKYLNIGNFGEPNPLGSVAFADVDADGDLEIFVQCVDSLFAFHHDGTELASVDADTANGVLFGFEEPYNYSTPSFEDLDGDVVREIICTSQDGKLYAIKNDGTLLPGFPIVVGGNITSSPAIGDIDGDGRAEIVFGSSPESGSKPSGHYEPTASRPPRTSSVAPKMLLHLASTTSKNQCAAGQISNCGQAVTENSVGAEYFVYVLGANLSPNTDLSGMSFGVTYNGTGMSGVDVWGWTLCADTEFQTSTWPQTGSGNRVAWNTGSNCQQDSIAVAGYFYITAYSADVMSLVANPSNGVARTVNCNSDGQILGSEDLGYVAFGSAGYNPCLENGPSGSLLNAYRVDGTQLGPGWPKAVPMLADVDASPALGDVDGDGQIDVVIGGSDGKLYVYEGDAYGASLTGFPLQIRDPASQPVELRSSPVLADIDGDGDLEIFFGDQSGGVHGISSSGANLAGFPIQTGGLIEGPVAVWDIDGDGSAEIVAQSADRHIYMWDMAGSFDSTYSVWPMFKRNSRNDGNLVLGFDWGTTGVPDALPVGHQRLISKVLQNPASRRRGTTIQFLSPENGTGAVKIYNVAGKLLGSERVTGVAGEWFEVKWDATMENGKPVSSGVYFYRANVGSLWISGRLVLTD